MRLDFQNRATSEMNNTQKYATGIFELKQETSQDTKEKAKLINCKEQKRQIRYTLVISSNHIRFLNPPKQTRQKNSLKVAASVQGKYWGPYNLDAFSHLLSHEKMPLYSE